MRVAWIGLVLAACGGDLDQDGFVAPEDCVEGDASANPEAPELCDGVDNDCDGLTDEPDAEDVSTFYIDRDGDGWGTDRYDRDGDGTPEAPGIQRTCVVPFGYSERDGDCDDDDDSVFPGTGCP